MSEMSVGNFREIIERWPSAAAFARDMTEATGMKVGYQRAWRWYDRDMVPPRYWPGMINAGSKVGLKLEPIHFFQIMAYKFPAIATVTERRRRAVHG